MMAVGSLECSSPSAWPSSCTATRNRSFPARREEGRPCGPRATHPTPGGRGRVGRQGDVSGAFTPAASDVPCKRGCGWAGVTTKSRKFINGKGRTRSRSRRWSSRSGSAAEAASRAEAGGRRPLPAPPEPGPPRRDWGRREGPGRARQDLCATRLHTGLEPTPGGPRPRGQQTRRWRAEAAEWPGPGTGPWGEGGEAGPARRSGRGRSKDRSTGSLGNRTFLRRHFAWETGETRPAGSCRERVLAAGRDEHRQQGGPCGTRDSEWPHASRAGAAGTVRGPGARETHSGPRGPPRSLGTGSRCRPVIRIPRGQKLPERRCGPVSRGRRQPPLL